MVMVKVKVTVEVKDPPIHEYRQQQAHIVWNFLLVSR